MCSYITLGSVSHKTQTLDNALRPDALATQRVGYVVDPVNPQLCYYIWDKGQVTVEMARLGTAEDIIFEEPSVLCDEYTGE